MRTRLPLRLVRIRHFMTEFSLPKGSFFILFNLTCYLGFFRTHLFKTPYGISSFRLFEVYFGSQSKHCLLFVIKQQSTGSHPNSDQLSNFSRKVQEAEKIFTLHVLLGNPTTKRCISRRQPFCWSGTDAGWSGAAYPYRNMYKFTDIHISRS